jgi:Secretion system C-terminal sorting domain/Right handed beta helix region
MLDDPYRYYGIERMYMKLLIALILFIPLTSQAASWLVMKDGSGDFTEIQAAVDGCAVGDTVLVGPGRYDTFVDLWPDLDWVAVIALSVDSLTVRALYPNTAIIGPPAGKKIFDGTDKIGEYHIGAAPLGTNSWMVIEDLVFENLQRGIDLFPSGIVRNCAFRSISDTGIFIEKGYDTLVEGCETHFTQYGVYITMYNYDGSPAEAIVRNCRSYDDYIGFSSTHPNAIFEDCYSQRSRGGFDIKSGKTSMVHCGVSNGNMSVTVGELGSLTMSDCIINGSEWCDIFLGNGYLYGTGNVLYGGAEEATIWVANSAAVFNGNYIHPSNGYTVNVDLHLSPEVDLDFRDNYWGSSDPDSIAEWIWDGVDNPSLGITVDYLPLQSQEAWAGIDVKTPLAPSLLEIYPNPFNPSTTIRFELPEPQHTKVAVYDVSGRLIKTLLDEFKSSGENEIKWNGRDATGRSVSSGSYFVRLQGDSIATVRKITLLR